MRILSSAAFLLVVSVAPSWAQTVTVSTTADSGPGSLREAVAAVNAGTANVIDMTGVAGTITLTTPLPSIVNAVTINGPGAGLSIQGSGGSVLLDAGALVTLNDIAIGDALTKTGSGAVTWDGESQTFSGLLAITGGSVTTTTDYLLSASSAVTLGAGTLLSTADTLQEAGSLAGAGTLDLGGGEYIAGLDNASSTFSGTIDGTSDGAFIQSGTGTLTLDGATINAGLFVIDDSSVVLASDISVNDLAVGGGLSAANLDLGGNQLTVLGGTQGSGVLSGSITGSGSLHITGNTGFVVDGLFGASLAHSGSTTVDGDAYLALFGDGSMGGQSSLTINDNAFVDIEGANTVTALSGNGGSLFLCFCATLTVDQDIDTTFAGDISDDGSGVLVKMGTGRLTLTGTNTYAGGTSVLGGTLSGTTSSLQGNILNNAIVEFDQSTAGTYAGVMSGTGALVKLGTGAVSLTGSNTYSGGTQVFDGLLSIDAAGALGTGGLSMAGGAVDVNADQTVSSLSGTAGAIGIASAQTLTIDQAANTSFAGNISGAGALVKDGTGVLELTGTNSYAGGTTVSGGTLAGTVDSLQGDITNNATVQFTQSSGEGTYAGGMSGTGALLVTGTGKLTLSGTNTYSGGTTLGAGTLEGTTSSLQGDISNGGTVIFNQNVGGAYAGSMSGAGALVKSGTGNLTLLSASSYTGGTTINGGAVMAKAIDAIGFGALTINDGFLHVNESQQVTSLTGTSSGGIVLQDFQTLTVDQSSNTTFAGVIDGNGGLVKDGTGTLTLTGDNRILGGLTVLDGGVTGTTNSLYGNIVNHAAVTFTDEGTGEYSWAMSGTGSLEFSGGGTLALTSGANTYTGGTSITGGGRIYSFGGGNLGNGAFDVGNGVYFQDAGDETVTSLSGSAAGLMLIEGTLTVNQSTNTTYAGVMFGELLEKSGTGALTFDQGFVAIDELRVNGGSIVAASDFVLAGVRFADIQAGGLTLQGWQEVGNLSVGAGASVDMADNLLILRGDSIGASVIEGTLSGAGGSFIVGGTADVTFLGQGSYTGETAVTDNARLTLVGDDRLSAETTLSLFDNGALVLEGNQTFAGLYGSGGSIALCDCATLTIVGDGASSADISGGGALVKDGTGLLNLTGTNSYTGGTTVLAGTLLGDAASLQGDIVNHADVVFSESGNGTYSGVMSGSGRLTVYGTGTMTLTGANTYSGGTFVYGGTLKGDTGSLQGDFENYGTLEFAQQTDATFSGGLSGSGTLTKSGAGTLTLGAANLFFGTIQVLEGTLVGDTSNLRGDILNNGSVVFNEAGFGFFSGAMSGSGSLVKSGAGFLFLSSPNSYTGGTSITDGGLIGDTLSIQGDVANDGVLYFAQTFDGSHAGAISGSGGVAKLGEGTVTLLGTNTYTGGTVIGQGTLAGTSLSLQGIIANNATVEFAQGFDGTYAGLMVGIGSLVKSGAGTLTLTGTTAHSGGTTVLGGTLAGTTSNLQGVIANFATVAFLDDDAATYAGSMSGTGRLVMAGDGVLTLSGANTYAGGTAVLSGTVRLGTNNAIGSGAARVEGVLDLAGFSATIAGLSGNGDVVLGSGTLNIGFSGDDSTFNGLITGRGSLVKSGGGSLTLNDSSDYTGGTSILSGAIRFGADDAIGSGAALVDGLLDLNGFDASLAGLSGDGRVALGSGRLEIDGDDSSLFGGVISGSGTLVKSGAGTLVLTGANTYSGGTSVLGGTLVGDTTSLGGDIENHALVFFDQDVVGAFDAVISGTGDLAKIGAGTLAINGAQTYTGFTQVAEGTLLLNGSLAGSVFVDPMGTLAGGGFIAGSVFINGILQSGASVSSSTAAGGGNGAGALAQPVQIGGDLTMTAASTYRMEVGPGGAVNPLTVGGTATIAGATLELTNNTDAAFASERRSMSTVLTAGDVVGGFGAVTGFEDIFESFLIVSATSIDVLMLNKNADLGAYGQTLNASGAGAALSSVQTGATGDLALVLRELRAIGTDAELSSALDIVSGSAHASFAGLSLIGSADVIDVLTTRFQSRGGWWMQGLGSSLSLEADVDPARSSAKTAGAVVGFDRQWRRAMAGIAAGYNDSNITGGGGRDSADGRAYRMAAYGQYRAGRVVLDGIVSGARHRVLGARGIDFAARLEPSLGGGLLFGGISRSAEFAYDATEIAAVADAGYVWRAAGFTVQPALGAQYTRIGREAFAEAGAGSLDLTAGADTVTSVAGRARLFVERRFDAAARRWVAPRATLRYTRELGSRDVPFAAAIAGARFTAEGFALPESLLAAKAGIAAGFAGVTVSFDYRAAFAAGHRHHLFSAGFGF